MIVLGKPGLTKGQSLPGVSWAIRTCTPPSVVKAGQSRISGTCDLVTADKAGIVFFPLVSQRDITGCCESKK